MRAKIEDGYVSSHALADALMVSVQTLYKWVSLGLVNDLRPNQTKGQPYFFGLRECYQATALAPVTKARSWTKKKYLQDPDKFERALTKYLTARSRGKIVEKTKVFFVVKDRGYFEGWEFPDLAKAAEGAYAMALHIQQTFSSVREPAVEFEAHASA